MDPTPPSEVQGGVESGRNIKGSKDEGLSAYGQLDDTNTVELIPVPGHEVGKSSLLPGHLEASGNSDDLDVEPFDGGAETPSLSQLSQ